jgi:hypothetical protein
VPRFRVLLVLLSAALTSLAAPAFALPAVPAAVTPTTLYAVDGANQTVVRFVEGATGTFTKTVIGRNLNAISRLAAVPAGNVYLLNDGRLVRISADGVQRSVAANLTGLNSLVVDPHGTVFVADAHRVIRIYQPSGKQSVMGSISQTIGNLGVDGSGRPTVTYPNGVVDPNAVGDMALATFPTTAGSQPTIRNISSIWETDVGRLVEAPNGVIFIEVWSGGGSGASAIERINARSTTATMVNTRYSAYAWTVDPRARMHLMQIRKWCAGPDEDCKPDYAVDEILVFPDIGGTPRKVPTSNLELPRRGIAVGADQTTYAAAEGELVRIPATGGPAQRVVSGSYSGLVVKPGS